MSTAAIIAEALSDVTVDALVTKRHAEDLALELAAALDARGYVLRKKPAARKKPEPVEIFAPNTGNAEVDAFMRKHHDPKRRPLPLPKAPGLPAPTIPARQRDAVEMAWARECERREEREDLRIADAQVLRDAIAIHRSPWMLTRSETKDGTNWMVRTSAKHPGMEIWVAKNNVPTARLYIDGESALGNRAASPREVEAEADARAGL